MPRLIRNHPAYVALSICVLAVSVGVNLVVFTIANALWIRPLPFPEPERVVTILPDTPGTLDLPQLKIFEGGIAGQVVTSPPWEGLLPQIEISGHARQIETLGVTSDYFRVLGLPVRGRDFSLEDERDGAEAVAIISHRLWSREFGGRAEMIGAIVRAAPVSIRVIGVAPPGFHGARRGERTDVWIPPSLVRRLAPAEWKGTPLPLMVLGRLGPGQTVTATQEEYRARLSGVLSSEKAAAVRSVTAVTEVFGTPESKTFIVRERNALFVVSGLAALVLLGGCATIAALTLMHYERRRSELAVRMCLGAGRRRLVLYLLHDISVLCILGSACAIFVAILGVPALRSLNLVGGVEIGRLDLSIDWRVCTVAITATAVTLLAAAALPLSRATRLNLASELVAGPTATTLGSLRIRQALLGLQVCSTVIVLISAGLFVRAVLHGFGTAAGFDVDQTVFVSVQEGGPNRRDASVDPRALIVERAARLTSILDRLPGVSAVAEGISPISPGASAHVSHLRTVRVQDREYQLRVGVLQGSPSLLTALGVPMMAGRSLTAGDSAVAPTPAVITLSLARRLWPDGEGLGQILSLPQLRGGPYQVVGIAGDFAFGSLAAPGSGVLVSAGIGASAIASSFVIRTNQPEVVSGLVSRAIRARVVRSETGREVVARDIGRQRLGAWFFSGFGLVALLLGAGGAFGVVAYLAESRRREFGIRLAVGATMAEVERHALLTALVPAAAGVAIGLAVGGMISQVFEALLVGVSGLDPGTYLLVAVSMLSCAASASMAGAWRLRGTSPADALRAT